TVVVLNMGRGFGLSGRLIDSAFLEEGIDVVCHGAMTPSGRGGKQIGAIMLEGRGGTQPYLSRMLKKARHLTRPTLAPRRALSPARPERVKDRGVPSVAH